MHQPAAVHWVVNRSRWLAQGLLFMWLLGLVALLAFFQNQVASLESVLTWAFAMLLVTGLAWQIWRGMPVGSLRWDGGAWHWSGFAGDAPCALALHMDFQRLLIVSVRQSGAHPVWLWLEPLSTATGWMPLRRAVVVTAATTPAEGVTDVPVSEHDSH